VASHDFKGVRELLSPVLGRLAREGAPAALMPLWAKVAGPHISRHVRPVALEGRTLVLEAQTARWQAEIAALEVSLLGKLNEALGPNTVSRLSIRVGG
jgi:predicted nucleic acid-binding Zn ribbon protein